MRKEEPNKALIARLNEVYARGITKADMARIAGVSPQAVNNWFKKGVISKKSALAIADAVGVSVAWLLGEDVGEKDGMKPDEPAPAGTLSPAARRRATEHAADRISAAKGARRTVCQVHGAAD